MPTNRKAEISKLSLYKPPARSEIQDAVHRLNKENKMADRFWAIIIYVVVMILLLVVCSGQRIHDRFLQTLSVSNVFVGKSNVNISFHKVCVKGPFKCCVTLFSLKFDTHPPPRNANNVEPYTLITFFSGKSNTPYPHCNT